MTGLRRLTVVGIDPGRAACGYAVLCCEAGQGLGLQVRLYQCGTANLGTKAGRERLRDVLRTAALLEEDAEEGWAHEARWRGLTLKQRLSGGGAARSERIAAGQAATVGTLEEMAEAAGLGRAPRWRIAPGTAKVALTGYGAASKDAMVQAARVRYGVTVDEHGADAIAVALAAARKWCAEEVWR
jgi:Holliday junction resolvasome RuvABC endonuclease subunit